MPSVRGRLALVIGFLSAYALAQSSKPANPLVGQWRYVDQNNCVDTYQFETDGSFSSTSGSEALEGIYTAEPPTNPGEGYVVVRTILKGNGRPDCDGLVTNQIGKRNVRYVFFNGERNDLFVCPSPRAQDCFGPLRRAVP